jgi:hypothetical protein
MTRTDIALLMTVATIALIAAFAGNAAADPVKTSCIDTKVSYVARALNSHEIWLQNSLGAKKPPVRVTTSCHHLQSSYAFSLSAQFTCLDKGDPVVATAGGEREHCIVTKVQPYAAADGDLAEKK